MARRSGLIKAAVGLVALGVVGVLFVRSARSVRAEPFNVSRDRLARWTLAMEPPSSSSGVLLGLQTAAGAGLGAVQRCLRAHGRIAERPPAARDTPHPAERVRRPRGRHARPRRAAGARARRRLRVGDARAAMHGAPARERARVSPGRCTSCSSICPCSTSSAGRSRNGCATAVRPRRSTPPLSPRSSSSRPPTRRSAAGCRCGPMRTRTVSRRFTSSELAPESLVRAP